TVAMFAQPLHGRVETSPFSDTLTYVPNIDYFGPDSFTYAVRDAAGAMSNIATVTIEVAAIKLVDGPIGKQLTIFGTGQRDVVRIEREGNRLVVHALLALPPGPAGAVACGRD